MPPITEVVVSDTETTGFDAATCSLLEVAFVRVPRPSSGTIAYQSFVEFEGEIPPDAKATHHITEAEVAPGARFCNPRARVIEELLGYEHDGMAWAFHNAKFDLTFLPELTRPVICTYQCSLHLYPDAPSHKNQALRYWLGLEPAEYAIQGGQAHRALYDSAVTAALVNHLVQMVGSFEELVRLTNSPVLLTTVNFGKHKGEKWADVPRDYAQWCLFRSDMAKDNPNLKYTLEVRLGLKDAA